MPQPPKPKRQPPRPGGPNGGQRPRQGGGGKRKKKKPASAISGQLVGGITLVVVVGFFGAIGVYMAPRFMPKPKPSSTPKPSEQVARPSIEPTLENATPKRPGLALAPDDEVYAPKAVDVHAATALDPPVNGLLAKGVLTVFADGRFRPNDPVPRAEFLVWCYNAVEAQTVAGADHFVSPKKAFPTVSDASGSEFKDVPQDYWAAPVLASIKESGIFDSVLDKTLRPDAPLTRQEWAGFAAYLATAKEARAKMPDEIDMTKLAVALRKASYTDASALKEEYRIPVFFIANDDKRRGWISDTFTPPDLPGPWGPNKPVSRGEAASWLGGFYDQVGLGLM